MVEGAPSNLQAEGSNISTTTKAICTRSKVCICILSSAKISSCLTEQLSHWPKWGQNQDLGIIMRCEGRFDFVSTKNLDIRIESYLGVGFHKCEGRSWWSKCKGD